MELPRDLRTALETELIGATSRQVTATARGLSQRYRAQHGRSSEPLLRSGVEVVAYAAYRLPATFAAAVAVLEEARARRPDLQPRTMLDVGGGPGTAAWAAVEVWPELEQINVLERDGHMIDMGRRLAVHSGSAALREATWRQVDITGPWKEDPADLTVATYLLGELPAEAQGELVERLWALTLDTCALLEPGTPRGFDIVRRAGEQLTRAGAHLIAPFPAQWLCLEGEGDWCHFSQRVPRTRVHRTVKDAALSYEDEKYSYLVAAREEGIPIAARVTRQPQIRSGHIRLVLCTAGGIKRMVVTRSNREAYRRAKDLTWGSAIEVEEGPLFGLG